MLTIAVLASRLGAPPYTAPPILDVLKLLGMNYYFKFNHHYKILTNWESLVIRQ